MLLATATPVEHGAGDGGSQVERFETLRCSAPTAGGFRFGPLKTAKRLHMFVFLQLFSLKERDVKGFGIDRDRPSRVALQGILPEWRCKPAASCSP